jgi:hypothetical protein
MVVKAVHAALVSLTGQNLGTELKPWQEWWNRQK